MNFNLLSMKNFTFKKRNRVVFRLVLFLFAGTLIGSCEDEFGEVNKTKSMFQDGTGVFIINEGNYGAGNGSLSFLNFDSLKIYNGVFQMANNRPLGDVPYSMTIMNDKAWVVVNNSGKIEIINLTDMKSTDTLTGFVSPRYVLPLSRQKVYISDFYSDKVAVVNPQTLQVTRQISIGRCSEQMLLAENKVFVAFWSNFPYPSLENNQLLVINAETDALSDSIQVGKEPNSMVLDKNGKIWVLCSGGFMGDEFPTLWQIDPNSHEILKKLTFPDIYTSPTHLCKNQAGDSLFFLSLDIYGMHVNAANLPETPILQSEGRYYYSLAVAPGTSDILLSDAIDYQQQGIIYHYSAHGTLKGSYQAGIIPGNFTFN